MSGALGHPAFRIFWVGSILSFTAQWTQQVALGWVAYELTASSVMLGLIIGIRALPIVLFAPWSGVAADRYDRRALLAGSQIVLGVATALLALLLWLGAVRSWHLFAFVLVAGVAFVFERNARHAMVLDLVPRADALNAVALNSVGFSGARVIAPVIAGALIVWVGAAGNFLLQAVAYAFVAVSLLLIPVAKRASEKEIRHPWASLVEGLQFSSRDPAMRLLFLSGAVPAFLFIPVWGTLLPVFAKDVFQVGPQELGWLFTAIGAGGVLGGVLGVASSRVDRLALVQLSAMVLFGASLVGMALAPSFEIALVWVTLAGVGEMLGITANQTLIQVAAPEAMRGRVTSLIVMFPALISLGSIVVGVGAEALGPRGITGLLAAIGLLLCGWLWLGAPRLRALRVSDYR